MKTKVSIIGAGLAGSECALTLAKLGVDVDLYEMRPAKSSPAHKTDAFAELVCSNSLKSLREESAAGLLKHELWLMGSSLLKHAIKCRVPAGSALAVDRDAFSLSVTQELHQNKHINIIYKEVQDLPQEPAVIAAGPLCADKLFNALSSRLGSERLYFFDAAAPIVDADSLDKSVIFRQSRYGEASMGDYLNCPFTKEEYSAFITALLGAQKHIAKDFEQKELFSACQPVEEIARKGIDALRFGPMKPVGLTDPRSQKRPWAAVQLRSENSYQSAYNLVGFQTNLRWEEQKRVFRMIPGLAHAEFFRYGVMHRNSYVNTPQCLDSSFAIPHTSIRLAGQMSGTEGYTEAIASGFIAALNTYAELKALPLVHLPKTSAFGSLVSYATNPLTDPYQPMHVNFGLLPPLSQKISSKKERYKHYALRAKTDLGAYVLSRADLFGKLARVWPAEGDFA